MEEGGERERDYTCVWQTTEKIRLSSFSYVSEILEPKEDEKTI